jgi:phosphoribosylaminoimidazole carboxylase (NCAIR synthetase)
MPLGSTQSAAVFGMRNFLGLDKQLKTSLPDLTLPSSSRFVWYKKKESRLRRKLGHVTIWAENLDGWTSIKEQLERAESQWRNSYFVLD